MSFRSDCGVQNVLTLPLLILLPCAMQTTSTGGDWLSLWLPDMSLELLISPSLSLPPAWRRKQKQLTGEQKPGRNHWNGSPVARNPSCSFSTALSGTLKAKSCLQTSFLRRSKLSASPRQQSPGSLLGGTRESLIHFHLCLWAYW